MMRSSTRYHASSSGPTSSARTRARVVPLSQKISGCSMANSVCPRACAAAHHRDARILVSLERVQRIDDEREFHGGGRAKRTPMLPQRTSGRGALQRVPRAATTRRAHRLPRSCSGASYPHRRPRGGRTTDCRALSARPRCRRSRVPLRAPRGSSAPARGARTRARARPRRHAGRTRHRPRRTRPSPRWPHV